jgi:DNA-binding MarR family transcriptional regulator
VRKTRSPVAAAASVGFYQPETLDAERSIGMLMRRALQSVVQAVDRQLVEHDLTHAQWVPLFKLYRDECATMAGLSRELQIDPAAMTRALDRLEAKGLVRRARSEQDRRVVQLELTDAGSRLAPQVPAVLSDVLNAHLAGFSKAESETLIGLLRRVVANGETLRDAKDAR